MRVQDGKVFCCADIMCVCNMLHELSADVQEDVTPCAVLIEL